MNYKDQKDFHKPQRSIYYGLFENVLINVAKHFPLPLKFVLKNGFQMLH